MRWVSELVSQGSPLSGGMAPSCGSAICAEILDARDLPQVVLLALTQQPLLEFLLEFDTQGLDVTQRVWLSGWPYLECVAEAVELLPPERQADGFRVLHGLVAAREWETDNLTEWQDVSAPTPRFMAESCRVMVSRTPADHAHPVPCNAAGTARPRA